VHANSRLRASFDAWSLGLEASSVIALRTLKIVSGGVGAKNEVHQMVTEKVEAWLALQGLALSGGLGRTAHSVTIKSIEHYRRKVGANGRRLRKE